MFKRTSWGWVFLTGFLALCIWLLTSTKFNLGIDLQGGTELTYSLDLRQIREDPEDVANEVKDIISRRLDIYGLKEIRIAVQGQNRLVVTIPGASESSGFIKEQIEKAGNLRLQLVSDPRPTEQDVENTRKLERDYENARIEWASAVRQWEQDKEAAEETGARFSEPEPEEPVEPDFVVRTLYTKRGENGEALEEAIPDRDIILANDSESVVEGSQIETAGSTIDNNRNPAVAFTMRGPGGTELGEMTNAHKNEQLGIVLDERVLSAPTIQDRITTNGIITGSFSPEEVNSLVTILKGGSLPTKPLLLQENKVGSVFGEASIKSGFRAILIGLVCVMLTMAAYYLFGGLVANFALVFNVMVVLSYVACFRQTLTLPGIAGILLTIGMAVDANILIFERVREERDRGKSLMQSLATGYQRAFSVIFDSNLTTVITGIVLFNFGSGPVKGFAVTLIAGILISFISALFVTRLVLSTALNLGLVKKLKMFRAFETPKIVFSRIQKPFLVFTSLIIVVSWVFVLPRGKENYGIDFTGGARIGITLMNAWPRIAGADSDNDGFDDGFEGLIRRLETENPELFRQFSLQQVQIGGQEDRNYVLLTRAGAADDEVEQDDASRQESAQNVQKAVAKALKDANNLLPPPFVLDWRDAGDGKAKKLHLNVNIVPLASDEDVTKADRPEVVRQLLEKELTEILTADERVAENTEVDFPGVKLETVSIVKPPVDGATERRPVTTYEVVFSGYTPPATAALDTGAPTRLQLENIVQEAFRDERLKSKIELSTPFPTIATVGPVVASNLQGQALVALFISILGIIFYVSLRFEFIFGLAAIAALLHDVLITIGIMALTDKFFPGSFPVKINLPEVAALLTIIGYSINDTIVVFDRIRENLRIHGRKTINFTDCINLSINQTLSRTLWTSITTLLTVCALLFLGGEAVRGFAYTFLIGLIAGTYSSVFVASPILMMLNKRAVRRREAVAAEAV